MNSVTSFLKHPVFIIAVIGIIARLVISPLMGVGYDADYWAVIVRNLESGQGLYGLEGYYYTPIWGYFLSFESMIQETFLHIDVLGIRVPEAFMMESFTVWWSANATSISFNIFTEIPFILSDLLVGYLIYWLIKDITKNEKKAALGFALWFLCPLIICVTSISGMFDTFSVLFAMLCIVMVRKDKLFLAGVLFMFAVLTKFFPVYLLFLLLGYIMVKHRADGAAFKSVLKALLGGVLAFFVLMLPQILNGELGESLLFITSRATSGNEAFSLIGIMTNGAVLVFAAGVIVAVFLGYLLSKKKEEELDRYFFKYALMLSVFLFMYPPLPQYLVFLIPFLAIYIAAADRRFIWSWLLLSVGGASFIASGNFTLFLSLGSFTDFMSLDHIVSGIDWYQTSAVFGISPRDIQYYASGVIQYLGVVTAAGIFLRDWYAGGRKGEKVFGARAFALGHRSKDQRPES